MINTTTRKRDNTGSRMDYSRSRDSGAKSQCCRCRAPPSKNTKTEANNRTCEFGVAITVHRFHLFVSRTDALPQDLPFRLPRYQYGCAPPPAPVLPLAATLGVLCRVAWSAALRLVPVPHPPRHETARRFDDPPIPRATLHSRRLQQHRIYSEQQIRAFRGSLGGSKHLDHIMLL